jgi:hypothetical protein
VKIKNRQYRLRDEDITALRRFADAHPGLVSARAALQAAVAVAARVAGSRRDR